MRIFLSYASEQTDVAEPIAFSLRRRGHKVFLDKDDLPPGASYDDQIEKAIATSDVFLFLISPSSVTKGRFTLTELLLARKKWPVAHRNILPVMAVPTDYDNVPSYLTAVTVLEPHGNMAAEVASAVEELRQGVPAHIVVPGMAGLGLLSGLASCLVPNFLPDWRLSGLVINLHPAGKFGIPLHVGFFFAIALCAGMYRWQRTSPAKQIVLALSIILGWLVAVNYGYQTQEFQFRPDLSGVSGDVRESLTTQMDTLDVLKHTVVGLICGLLGALFTYGGVAMAEARLRSWDRFLLIIGVGTLLGGLLGVAINDYSFGLLPPLGWLYVIWQAGVSAAIGFGLSRPLR